ncbi:MAG: hypothetical protein U1F57_01820 [bacterium]
MKKVYFLLLAVFVLSCVSGTLHAQSPKAFTPPEATYKAYALSDNTMSFDPKSVENKRRVRNGFGFVPKILGQGDGFVQIASSALQGSLSVPMGWEGMDDGKKLRVFTPDNEILIVLNWVDCGKYGGFEEFKKKFFEQSARDFKERKKTNPQFKLELLNLVDGNFGHKILNNQDELETFSLITLFFQQPDKPGYALRVNLSAPPEKLDKYQGLLGLLMKDFKVLKDPVY